MPFTEERAERLKALFELIEQNGDCTAHELTYQAVPCLKETDELVNDQLASEEPYDKVTLLDSATIMRYLAEAYDRLGRFAVSVRYYKRAIELAATLPRRRTARRICSAVCSIVPIAEVPCGSTSITQIKPFNTSTAPTTELIAALVPQPIISAPTLSNRW